jgi:hypothetical protein
VLLLILLLRTKELVSLLEKIANSSNQKEAILNYASSLSGVKAPIRKEILIAARKSLRLVLNEGGKRIVKLDYFLHKKTSGKV